ncbi:MAG: tRNA pseudouridine synthase A [Fuerstiella sp.]|jgi:tRNA pseudouridine38-40 synthase|nr:tRNA pseudouridine synthase A [Fuerstiella sp.]MCP4510308.1 tRNA pseudouridine synthase A [Fuerstiella sp.]MDG2128109.1 tRNA pseudouridine synthase A [Fuerstiella sp.]
MYRNIMLTVAYEGTHYRGWQIQPNGKTVQEFVERATEKLTGTRCNVLCAGRTDSGVHALGQVACFRTESKIAAPQFRRGLQRFLPDDIAIVQSREVSDQFHATYSAIRKRYRYLIFDGAVLPPFLRNLVHRSRRMLNTSAMLEALPALMGTHDFRCFETNYPNKATSIRTVMEVTLQRVSHWSLWTPASVQQSISIQEDSQNRQSPGSDQKDAAGHCWLPTDPRPHEDPASPVICFEIMADGFLYNMVRAIVGTLLRIGTGTEPPEYMADVVASMDRGRAGCTATPEGLYLVHVDYPEEQLTPD